MRLCLRLAAMAAFLVVVALGLIALRTDTVQTGNKLHVLYGEKLELERRCDRLELQIAALKNQDRMRQEAAEIMKADQAEVSQPIGAPHGKGAGSREPSLLVKGPRSRS
jgi:hypothetical protein